MFGSTRKNHVSGSEHRSVVLGAEHSNRSLVCVWRWDDLPVELVGQVDNVLPAAVADPEGQDFGIEGLDDVRDALAVCSSEGIDTIAGEKSIGYILVVFFNVEGVDGTGVGFCCNGDGLPLKFIVDIVNDC